MADKLSKEARSQNMAKVKNKDTKPEKAVRSLLFQQGFRFRIHLKDLPGKPDIVFTKTKKAIFVHGCFWHGHNCRKGKRPSSNTEFWNNKLSKNIERDSLNISKLSELGFKVLVIWECQIKDLTNLNSTLLSFLRNG